MRVLSEGQFRAATKGGLPEAEPIHRPDDAAEIWSVPVPMPGEQLEYTLSAIVRPRGGAGRDVTVVDPGWAAPETHAHLAAALGRLDRELADVSHIVVTHAHPDHVGAAAELRRLSGARILMHEREQLAIDRARAAESGGGVDVARLVREWGVPSEVADRLAATAGLTRGGADLPEAADVLLRDDDPLPIPGVDWRVLWTPGHTSGHICLVAQAERILVAGDHVLPTVFPGVGIGVDWGLGPADGDAESPIAAYLGSLDRLRPYDDFQVLPGHGYRFSGLAERRAEASGHILTRAREVAASDAAAPGSSIWELASGLSWSAGWENLERGSALPSALLQASMYRDFVREGGLAAHEG